MTLEEFILNVRRYDDTIRVIYYLASLADLPDGQLDDYKKLGYYAAVQKVNDIETAVAQLRAIFNPPA